MIPWAAQADVCGAKRRRRDRGAGANSLLRSEVGARGRHHCWYRMARLLLPGACATIAVSFVGCACGPTRDVNVSSTSVVFVVTRACIAFWSPCNGLAP